MADPASYDSIAKIVQKWIDDWQKDLEKIAKDLAKLQAEADKADGGNADASNKKQLDLAKSAEDASKDLTNKIWDLKIPPQSDPKQMIKLPDFITKNVTKSGLKLGDYGSIKPDFDIDIKKMKIKKAGIVWTWDF